MTVWGRAGTLALVLTACTAEGAGDGGSTGREPDASTTGGLTGESVSPGSTTSTAGSSSSGDPQTGGGSGSSGTGASWASTTTAGESSTGSNGGLGELMGECGVVDVAALTGDEPGFIVNMLDFGDDGFDYDSLTPGGQAVFDAGNLGGSSLYSEVIAFDVLARCEAAELLKTETEIEYDSEGIRTDLLVAFEGTKIGVSVTRGQGFPLEDPYSVKQAQALLQDKLSDIPMSTANVAPEDAWQKQILHIIAYGPMHAQSLQTAYDTLGPEYTLDTVVVVTVTEGEDLFIYTE